MKKYCSKCLIEKEINTKNFYKSPTGKDGFRNVCKNCNSQDSYGKDHQGTITEFNNKRKQSLEFPDGTKLCIDCKVRQNKNNFLMDGPILGAKCKSCQSFRRIFDKYGLTKEEYLNILEDQNHCCKICKNKELFYQKLIVDHNHNTGKVRGLLCSSCNQGLGKFKDNIEALKEAIEYLQNS